MDFIALGMSWVNVLFEMGHSRTLFRLFLVSSNINIIFTAVGGEK